MNGNGAAIRRFELLNAEDRQWLILQLSAAEKVSLARALGVREEDTLLYEKMHTAKVVRVLEKCDATQIAKQLSGEPAWLIATVLSATSWDWRSKVTKLMPPNLRASIEVLQDGGLIIPVPMLSRLLVILRDRVFEVESASRVETVHSQFEQILAVQRESVAC